jgi:UDPglucose--hexose-1-phosphate uridylyltransferase
VSSQVLGPHERARDEAARAFHDATGELLLGSLLARELDAGERIVEETPRFVVLCPYAPHQSRQTWIVPRDPHGAFAAADAALLPELATLLGRTLRRIRAVTSGTDYNLVFRSPPVAAAASPHAFWYLDVLPRSSGGAGYELGTGIDLVVIPPEEAAADLRAATP